MDLHIDIELRAGLMLVTANGKVRFDEVSRHFRQVWDTAAENQVNKILVNSLAVEGELATFERYDLGVEIAEYLTGRQMNVKLAIVGRLPAVNGFGVRVARNRRRGHRSVSLPAVVIATFFRMTLKYPS